MNNQVRKIVKVLPAEGANPEFKPDERLIEGIECRGMIMLLISNDGTQVVEFADAISVIEIKNWLRDNSQVASIVRQACAIAEGEIKAREIYEETREPMGESIIQLFKE